MHHHKELYIVAFLRILSANSLWGQNLNSVVEKDDSSNAGFVLKYRQKTGYNLGFQFLFPPVIYGTARSRIGIPPHFRYNLNSAVRTKDIHCLEKMIMSETPEIQVYAVEGFYTLKKARVKIFSTELDRIREIKSKSEYTNVCDGCIFHERTIKEATNPFKFR